MYSIVVLKNEIFLAMTTIVFASLTDSLNLIVTPPLNTSIIGKIFPRSDLGKIHRERSQKKSLSTYLRSLFFRTTSIFYSDKILKVVLLHSCANLEQAIRCTSIKNMSALVRCSKGNLKVH